MDTETHDVAIIGGGPAGLSAALVLARARARRRVIVIDAGEPRNAPATHGFLSRDGTPPAELLRAGRGEICRYGAELVFDRVVDVAAGFTLTLAGGRGVDARHVLLATGATDRLPEEIEGARERWAATSCTVRTATAGRFATGRSASSPRSSTRNCCANGAMT